MNDWRGERDLVVPFEAGQINLALSLAQEKFDSSQSDLEKYQYLLFLISAKSRLISFKSGVFSRDALEFCKQANLFGNAESLILSAQIYILIGEKSLALKNLETAAAKIFPEDKENFALFNLTFAMHGIYFGDLNSASNYLKESESNYSKYNSDTLLHQEIIFYQAIFAYLQNDYSQAEDLLDVSQSYFESDFEDVRYNYLLARTLLLKLLLSEQLLIPQQKNLQKQVEKLLNLQDKEVAIALEAFVEKLMTLKQ